MDSKQTKNEPKNLNISQDSTNIKTLYPFANVQNQSAQIPNSEDLLNMYSPQNIDMYYNHDAYITAQDSIGLGVGLVSTILGVFGGPISLTIGSIIGVVSAILSFLPKSKDAKGQLKIWNDLIEHTKQLINDAITTDAINRAKSIVDGLNNLITDYNSKLDAWNAGPKTRDLNSDMRQKFISTNTEFLSTIPQLQQLGHQVSFLPLFAIAANYHLLLLRDVSVYGKKWGISDEFIKDYYEGPQGQLNKTREYIDYAVRVYKEGLDKAKKIPNSNSLNWERYNQYRTDMTLTVLDIIALFPTYDNHKYNKSTKVELSREVYTGMISYITNPFTTNPSVGQGFQGYSQNDFDKIETALIRKAHLFTWLSQITRFSYSQYAQSRFITAVQNKYHYTLSNTIITGPTHGVRYSGDTSSSIDLTTKKDIYSTKSSILPLETYDHLKELQLGTARYFGVTSHTHSITDKTTSNRAEQLLGDDIWQNENISNKIATGPTSITSEIPYKDGVPPTANNYSHRLSYISAYATDCGAIKGVRGDGCYRTPHLCAWTHVSADSENTIATDKITQISAVKAYELLSAEVVTNTYHTGGDIIKLPAPLVVSPWDSKSMDSSYLNISVKVPANKKYNIRLHYASTGNNSLLINYSGQNKTISLDKTMNSENDLYKYDSFKYLDLNFTITGNGYNSNMKLSTSWEGLLTNDFIFINKIEFIPV